MLQDVIDLRRVKFMECNCLGAALHPLLGPVELLAYVLLSASNPCVSSRGEMGM